MSKENLHFDDKSKQVVFPFFRHGVSKRNREHVLYVSIESYRNTRESLENSSSKKLWIVFPLHFSFSQTSTRVSIKQLDYELEISIA